MIWGYPYFRKSLKWSERPPLDYMPIQDLEGHCFWDSSGGLAVVGSPSSKLSSQNHPSSSSITKNHPRSTSITPYTRLKASIVLPRSPSETPASTSLRRSQGAFTTLPALRYSQPTTFRPLCSSLKTSALVMIRARCVFSATYAV